MLCKALDMTKQAHLGQVLRLLRRLRRLCLQVRRSGDPYWTHPLSVADILDKASVDRLP